MTFRKWLKLQYIIIFRYKKHSDLIEMVDTLKRQRNNIHEMVTDSYDCLEGRIDIIKDKIVSDYEGSVS